MALTPKTDLQVLPSAFETTFTNELQQKVNRNPSFDATDTPTRVVKEWGELQDGTMRSMQGFVSKNVRNVLEFGDAGTSVADATTTATLQAAIDACVVSGDALYLGATEYHINSTLTVTGRISIRGTVDRSDLVWTGSPGGTMFDMQNAIWDFRDLEFSAPTNIPNTYISMSVGGSFVVLRNVYFIESDGPAVHFTAGVRHTLFDNVLLTGCFEGVRIDTAGSDMGSNTAMTTFNNLKITDGGRAIGPAVIFTDALGVDLGLVAFRDVQYVTFNEPLNNSSIITFDQDTANGPFVSLTMENIQFSRPYTPTLAHYMVYIAKSTDETALRFRFSNLVMIHDNLNDYIGGAIAAYKVPTKTTFLPYVSHWQSNDFVLIDDPIHLKVDPGASNFNVFKIRVGSESNPRFRMEEQGDHFWSDGTGSGDVRLYRQSAGVLATDTNVRIGGRYSNNDLDTLTNTATPSVAAGNVFITGGTTTITDLTGGTHSQVIIIKAVHTLTITHGASTINLQGDVNFDMVTGDNLTLFYDGTDWWESSRRT